MGRHFGSLGIKVNGLIYYSLSPHEQRAFAGYLTKTIPNTLRRIKESILPVILPSFATYVLYDWAEKENVRRARKNPKDFENDV
ncbi:hypothetical protein HELRODRAFT_86839 [Helobdella robusta]|uniref:Cytochrome b-c1 complex subunit 8 n=1 Tax=Helobdella robusta TaxID=6412 RepID=T1G6H9_HELRO|nr:hypothetical protein HELRODRAFT_86839 [Helobdella robusta]ESN95339.1 hypothetical protein HELRODRAFT_86839 [Helobdella robusta]